MARGQQMGSHGHISGQLETCPGRTPKTKPQEADQTPWDQDKEVQRPDQVREKKQETLLPKKSTPQVRNIPPLVNNCQ